jgi:hypothetical protein
MLHQKNLIKNDPSLDFMDPNRRKKLIEYYLSNQKALPGKDVKALKYSRLDRFANTIEINFDLAANAQVKSMEIIEQVQRDIGFWHL